MTAPTAAEVSSAENLQSAGLMTLAMFGYVVNDAFIKLASEEMPLFQAIFLRGFVIVVILTLINAARGTLRNVHTHLSNPVAFRLAAETIGTILYLSALARVPLAPLTAVLQIVPVIVTFVAARLLRERVSARRIAAVMLGFSGVMLVVRPWSDAFSPWFILGFIVVGLIVVRELATRRIASSAPSQAVALYTAITITVMGLVLSFVEGWGETTPRVLALLAAAACFLTIGYVASVATVRVGDLSFSAPFRYTIVVFSIILQIVVFRDVPDAFTLAGSAVVVAAGLLAFRPVRTVVPDGVASRS